MKISYLKQGYKYKCCLKHGYKPKNENKLFKTWL